VNRRTDNGSVPNPLKARGHIELQSEENPMLVDFAHDPSQATSGLWAEIEKRFVVKTMIGLMIVLGLALVTTHFCVAQAGAPTDLQ